MQRLTLEDLIADFADKPAPKPVKPARERRKSKLYSTATVNGVAVDCHGHSRDDWKLIRRERPTTINGMGID